MIDTFNRHQAKKHLKTPVDGFKENAYRQPSLTEPHLFPESYRLKSTFGSIHLKESPAGSSTTFNALISPDQGSIRRGSATEETTRRRSFTETMLSFFPGMESSSSHPLEQDADIERSGGQSTFIETPEMAIAREPTIQSMLSEEEKYDEDQLDQFVNEVLEGVADLEEVKNVPRYY